MSMDREHEKELSLVRAAARGDEEKVTELLEQGVDANCADWSGATPLHDAASGGHVGVAELLLRHGAQVDSRNKRGGTPKDIAASIDVPPTHDDKDRVLKGRKMILELFAEKVVRPYKRKVGPEGGELQTMYCSVSVPRGAITIGVEITCQVINPNDITLPLEVGDMLVSDIIELGPHGTTFHQPVTVQMQYNSASSRGTREAVVWVTTAEDRSQWTELETTKLREGKLAVSLDHSSVFAVISQPKQDKFTVSTEGFKLTSSTQPAVQISFPEQAVITPTPVTLQVHEIEKEAVEELKAHMQEQSFRGVVSTSPLVKVKTDSENVTVFTHDEPRSSACSCLPIRRHSMPQSYSAVQFHKPVTVRVPHPQRYMGIRHGGPTKLRMMSCEEGTEDWVDVTDDTIKQDTEEFVYFEVTHFTRWIVIVVEDIYDEPEELGPIPLNLCRWLQHRDVQFTLMQRKDNKNQIVIECTAEHAGTQHAKLVPKGYYGPLPSDKVTIFEGQKVEVRLLGNVSIAPSCTQRHMTFHSQKPNRLHMQVESHDGSDGNGTVAFFALPRVNVQKEKDKGVKICCVRKKLNKIGHRGAVLQPKELCELPISVPCDACGKDVEKHFVFIKENVSTDWQDLAFHLGFNGADTANIERRNRDDKSCCIDMLWEWQKRRGQSATIEVLKEALSKAGLQSVVDGLCKHLSGKPQQGEKK